VRSTLSPPLLAKEITMGQVDREYSKQQRWGFADALVELYRHAADLGAYALARRNDELDDKPGTQDLSWWTLLYDECVAKRDSFEKVIRITRLRLGLRISVHPPDPYNGRRIYLKDFVQEGAEPTNVPTPDEVYAGLELATTCKGYLLRKYGDVLPHLKEDYIDEAEHQDGLEYWQQFRSSTQAADWSALDIEMVLYAANKED
jgi:hypothetical protein